MSKQIKAKLIRVVRLSTSDVVQGVKSTGQDTLVVKMIIFK